MHCNQLTELTIFGRDSSCRARHRGNAENYRNQARVKHLEGKQQTVARCTR